MVQPIVLIPSCTQKRGPHQYFAVQTKYVEAVAGGAGCAPLLLPALGPATDWDAVLAICSGILLTGAASNVHPSHFGQDVHNPALPLDPARDATTLPLIAAARARGMPLLAICRGFQECNVALGGSLHQAVHEQPGLMDHRENYTDPLEQQYAARHPVQPVPGGLLARVLGAALGAALGADGTLQVNSLHGQGIDRLGAGLRVEARAEDGLIEAYSQTDAGTFLLGVQWHPEWQYADNEASRKIFAAFGQACRAYQQQNQEQRQAPQRN